MAAFCRKRQIYPFLLLVSILLCGTSIHPVRSAPIGGVVSAGSAAVNQTGNITTITQATNQAILNWQSFSIAPNELVQFLQPSSSAIALNRVLGNDPSFILGTLRANGRLFLVNPNGILFGSGSVVNVGGLLATTLSISDNDFLKGNYRFSQPTNTPLSFVVNQGIIQGAPGGSVVLLAPLVVNQGTILVPQGSVGLGAASKAVLSYDTDGMVNFILDNPSAIPQNVLLSWQAYGQIIQNVVNAKNVVNATAELQQDGNVVLTQGEGIAVNSGTIEANGGTNANAGTVSMNSTQATFLAPTSLIEANGIGTNSNGGHVRIFSEGNTDFQSGALIQAKGGGTGNGGFVETSAANLLWVDGQVDTTAPNGQQGTWLLDPMNITIVDGFGSLDGNLPGVLFATADNGADTISVQQLQSSTSNITLQANNSITINNIASGTITLQPNVTLEMDTNNGNITFLNPNNTIIASNTGGIIIQADMSCGCGGQGNLGNLRANGVGSISVSTDGNITYNSIIAGGNVTLTSFEGTISALSNSSVVQGSSVLLQTYAGGIGNAATPVKTSTPNLQISNGGAAYLNNTTTSPGYVQITASANNSPVYFTNVGPLSNSFFFTGTTTNSPMYLSQNGTLTSLTLSVKDSDVQVTTTDGGFFSYSATSGTLTSRLPNTSVYFINSGAQGIYNSGASINIYDQSLRLLDQGGGIGTALQPLETQVTNTLNLNSRGDIYANNIGSLQNLLVSEGVAGKNVQFTASTGDFLTYVGASGVLTLSAPYTAVTANLPTALNSGSSNSIQAASLSLTSGQIGSAVQPLLMTTHSLYLLDTTSDIYVSNVGALSSLQVITTGHNISYSDSLGGTLNYTDAPGGLMFTLPYTTVNLELDTISNIGASNNITAPAVSLRGNSIGTLAQPLLMTTSALTTYSSVGDTYVTNSGDLSMLNVTAVPAGNISISTTTGDYLTYNGATRGLTLYFPSSAVGVTGDTIMNQGASNNITAQSLSLFVGGTDIGTSLQPVLTNVGSLTIEGGQNIYVTNAGHLTNLTTSLFTSSFNVDVTTALGDSLIYNPASGTINLNFPTTTTVVNAGTAPSPVSLNSITVTTASHDSMINYYTPDGSQTANITFSGATGLNTMNAIGTTLNFTNSSGGIAVGNVNLGTTNGINLTAAGAITGSGTGPNIIASTANLNAGSSIGTSLTPLTTQITTLNNANAANGPINIANTGDLTLGVIAAGGNSVMLNSTGSLLGLNTNRISGSSVSLTGTNGIGALSQFINTSASSLTTQATGLGASTYVNNTNSPSNLSLATNNGTVNLNAPGASVNFSSTSVLSANDPGANLNFTNAGGNLQLGLINVGSGNNVTLSAAGTILSNGTSNSITANTVTLSAGLDIGNISNPITMNANTLNVSTLNGNIDVINSKGISLNLINANGNGKSVSISNTRGDMYVNSVTSSGGSVNLASYHSIYDAPGFNVIANGNSSLTAETGTIGTSSNPVWVDILGGGLTVSMGGAQNGLSANISGSVGGSGLPIATSYPPGTVGYFNNVCFVGCTEIQFVQNQSVQTVLSEISLNLRNQNDDNPPQENLVTNETSSPDTEETSTSEPQTKTPNLQVIPEVNHRSYQTDMIPLSGFGGFIGADSSGTSYAEATLAAEQDRAFEEALGAVKGARCAGIGLVKYQKVSERHQRIAFSSAMASR